MNRADILLQIKDAEKEAQKILLDAQERQKIITSTARKEAADGLRNAEEALREEYAAITSSERERVVGLRDELLMKGREGASAIEKNSAERIKKAKIYLESLFERTIDATS